jgi:hypothetical protein
MTAVFGILSVLAIALLFASVFQRRIEQTLAPAVFAIIAILYFFGLAGALYTGILFVYGVSAGGLLFAALRFLQKRASFREQVLTPGLAVFGVWLILCVLLSVGRVVSQWDALTHWSLVVKNMYYCDAFGNIAGAGSAFAEYPPAVSLFEYFLARSSSVFSESIVYIAHNILLLSLLAPALSHLKRWQSATMLPAGLILLLLPLTSNTESYTNLYIDSTLGLLFAYILYTYVSQKRQSVFSGLCVAGGVFTLALAKPSAGGMAGIALGIIAFDALLSSREGKRNDWLVLLAAAGALAIAKLSWSAYLGAHVHADMWNTATRLTLPNLFSALRSPTDWQKETIAEFFRNICGHGCARLLGVSYVLWPLLLLGAAFALSRRWKERFGQTRLSVLCVGSAVGFGAYLASLLVSYLLVFPEYESVVNASFERYASSMLLGIIGVFVLLALDILLDEDVPRTVLSRVRLLGALLAVLLLIAPVHLADVRYFGKAEGKALRAQYAASESMGANRIPAGEPICYLSTDDSDRNDYCIARYNASPAKLVNGVFVPGMSADDLASALSTGYQYLYLDQIDDAFRTQYGSLFTADSEVSPQTLYRVITQEDGGVQLVRTE